LRTNEGFFIGVERLKEKMQNVYNEDEDANLVHKATPKEHSPFTVDNSLSHKI